MTPSLGLGLVAGLVLANGFFVAAEFALVAVRRSRVDQQADEGDRAAMLVQRTLERLDRYIAITQIGITSSTLAVGWIGEPAIASLVDAGMARLGLGVSNAVAHSVAALTTAFLVL